MSLAYKRVLLKLSGEALRGSAENSIFDISFVNRVCETVGQAVRQGAQIGIVVGGGNIWRGGMNPGVERSRGDHMGMLATVINSLELQDAFEKCGIDARVMTSLEMTQFAEPFVRDEAVRHLEAGRVVIFGGGTGNPYFTTDTAGALRAAEINADALLLAKNVDYIYDADPKNNPAARKLSEIGYDYFLKEGLRAIDATAAAFCREYSLKVLTFALSDPQNILRVLAGEKVGSLMRQGDDVVYLDK